MEGTYELSDNDSGILSLHFSGIDRAGNEIEIDVNEVTDTDLGPNQQSFSVFNNETLKADSIKPRLSSLNIVQRSEKSAFEYNNSSNHVFKSGDNLSVYFTVDESIDNDSFIVDLKIDNQSRKDLIELKKLNANDGKSWEVFYRIRDNDTGKLEWDISASDPAGNTLVKDDNVTSVPALKFAVFDNFSFTADTTSPLLDNLSIVASKVENAFAYDNHSRHVLKSRRQSDIDIQYKRLG